jgi:hypothetical protein
MGKRGDGRGMAAILNKAKSVKAEAEEAGEGSNEEFERGCLLGMDCWTFPALLTILLIFLVGGSR